MKRIIVILVALVFFSGCGAYNSRNMIRVRGNNMDFSYGLIACKNVHEVILLRETNAGKGESKYNIPNLDQYSCIEQVNPVIKKLVEEEIRLENEEADADRPVEDNG